MRYPIIMESIRVMIVDDVPHVRQGLAAVLRLASRNSGVRIEVVGEAGNGSEAIRQAQNLHPDVILMDLEMPVMDGYETTRHIKTHSPGCRVIALTIHDDETARRQASLAGVDDFIVKGAPMDSFIQAITKEKE
jgi:DNA-binding NarL/FixJ family response regulator